MRRRPPFDQTTRAGVIALTCGAGLVVGALVDGGSCLAATSARKPSHKTVPQPSRGDPADVTATIPAPKTQPVIAVDKDGNYPQFHLPTASRARMRACGLKWQGMKMAGESGDDTWREFATNCLAAAEPPKVETN